MTPRNIAFLGLGGIISACGLQVFELEPSAEQGAALPAVSEQPPPDIDPGDLHGTSAEPLTPPQSAAGPAAGQPPGSVESPLDDGAGTRQPDAGVAPNGCNAIDFLFVIDNSLSMLEEQSNLVASFPGFMQVVSEAIATTDHHVMVIDTDGWNGEGTEEASQCDDTLGAGKRTSASEEVCGIDGPQRFIEQGQANLTDVFSCLGRVGTFGDFGEQPMDAMLRALGPENGAAGCNTGFLRSDAILVVVLVTDEDDTRSDGDAEEWRRALVAAKGGNDRAVVVLGFVGDDNVEGGLPGGPCPRLNVSDGAPELQRFVRSMPLGSLASVCADNYAPFFANSVSSIRSACDTFSAAPR